MVAGDAEQGVQLPSEQSPLLGADGGVSKPEGKITTVIWTVLAGVLAVGLILMFTLPTKYWNDPFPSPNEILKSAPVIDGHIGEFIRVLRASASRFTSVYATRLARTRSNALREQRVCIRSQ